jgi:hypothetical protein
MTKPNDSAMVELTAEQVAEIRRRVDAHPILQAMLAAGEKAEPGRGTALREDIADKEPDARMIPFLDALDAEWERLASPAPSSLPAQGDGGGCHWCGQPWVYHGADCRA